MSFRSNSSLRLKLAAGLGGLLVISAALGITAIVLLSRLGPAIDVVLRENYRSVIAMEEAKEALERIDSGALYALLGRTDEARVLRTTNDDALREALAVELGNTTIEGEDVAADRLARLYDDYAAVLDRLFAAPVEVRETIYFAELRPLFVEIKDNADTILDLNQREMAAANEAARREASQARRLMLVLLLGAGVAAGALLLFVSRLVVRPVRHVTEAVREVQAGHLDVIVPVETRDEIGELASAFNELASTLREVRRSDRARLLRTQRATQLAIDGLPDAVALLSPSGEVELANATARKVFGLRPGARGDDAAHPWLDDLLKRPQPAAFPGFEGRLDGAIQIFDDDTERFFLPQAVGITDARQELAGVLLLLTDVTDLRRAYELKSDLLARTAHEIGTPLTSLRMALHLLLEERVGPLVPKQAELVEAARDDADRLARIATDIASLPRPAAGASRHVTLGSTSHP